jgi:hypothetical protein
VGKAAALRDALRDYDEARGVKGFLPEAYDCPITAFGAMQGALCCVMGRAATSQLVLRTAGIATCEGCRLAVPVTGRFLTPQPVILGGPPATIVQQLAERGAYCLYRCAGCRDGVEVGGGGKGVTLFSVSPAAFWAPNVHASPLPLSGRRCLNWC